MRCDYIEGDDLELYALDRLAEPDAAPVEEHLLVCEECRERLTECNAYVRAMRGALAALSTGATAK